ncbi:hypothetical protein PM3016_5439 [Paenibacillus mucilaginosus 3016]|uniref:Phage head-tail adaptor n=2 Tax=Paenibacillus mucilaginosus TaxID=61624 RepID=H6NDU0_9BACL|nr:hypothetical protein [Paenibacillus mucilaginosus]AFC32139.1 hypothetical protein PM3016_5439 [Paenibacillus mucilaginosus 3016]
MPHFDFAEVFGEWGKKFHRFPKGGGYYDYANGGKWVPGYGAPVEMEGIIVPMSFEELQLETGGTYTRDDRKIYVRLPAELAIDDRIMHKGLEYRVLEAKPYDEYSDHRIYIAKRVSTKGRGPDA